MGAADRIAVGRVVKAHGLRGEVAVELLTDFPERFVPGLDLELRDDSGELSPARVASVRPHGGRILIRFEGVSSPEAAEVLRGRDLVVKPGEIAPRPEGYVFHFEVEGCAAFDREGRPLGTVRELVETGGHPLLVLQTKCGSREVPFVHPIVVSIDTAARRVVLDPPAGLLD